MEQQVFGRVVWLWRDGGEGWWSDGRCALVCEVFNYSREVLVGFKTSKMTGRAISRFEPMSSMPVLSLS